MTEAEWLALSKNEGDMSYLTDTFELALYANSSEERLAFRTRAQTFAGMQTFPDDLKLGIDVCLILDDDGNTDIRCAANDDIRIRTGNGQRIRFTNTFIQFGEPMMSGDYYRYDTPQATPGIKPNRIFTYSKDVAGKAHFHALDEDGLEHDLTPNPSFTGSYTNGDGDTVTVVNGIITTVV